MFQDVWVANYLGLRVGKMFMLKCKVCTCLDLKEEKSYKFFPKFDGLQNHVG